MQFKDKYKFTVDENTRFARSQITRLVYNGSHIAGINATYPQTQTIVDGISVSGITITDLLTVFHLKMAYFHMFYHVHDSIITTATAVNKIADITVRLIENKPLFIHEMEQKYLDSVLNDKNNSTTDKALTLLYHMVSKPLFQTNNISTAFISANQIMIQGGAGLISIPVNKTDEWHNLLSNAISTNNMDTIKMWTYQNAIFGIDIREK